MATMTALLEELLDITRDLSSTPTSTPDGDNTRDVSSTPPTATSLPAPTATMTPVDGQPTATSAAATPFGVGQPTATPVEPTDTDLGWMDRYLQSPGYDSDWGEPKTGGTFIFGAQRDNSRFNLYIQACCYTHGCWRGLPVNSLFRIDPWTGDLTSIEGDLVETWDMAADGKTLTMQLRQGVMFFDEANVAEESPVPAEFNGGKILGDEFVFEDAVATYQRYVFPPDNVKQFLTVGRSNLSHLESTSCPDGPRGFTFVMHFNEPRPLA